jgi:ADP-ribose pyrophosphatase
VTEQLSEIQVSSTELFQGQLLRACRDEVRLPNGAVVMREYVVHPGAVMVIPLLEDAQGQIKLVLERQFRYPMGRVMIEFPAGKLDARESCFDCAVRELREETGYTAAQWAHAGTLNPLIAYSTEFIDIWFARHLTLGQRQLDDEEFLEVFTVVPDTFFAMCQNGEITDGKTLVAALWLQNMQSGLWSLDWMSC